MDATIIVYLERIEAHLNFIVSLIIIALLYKGVSKFTKFIIRKVKQRNDRLRNSSPRVP